MTREEFITKAQEQGWKSTDIEEAVQSVEEMVKNGLNPIPYEQYLRDLAPPDITRYP